MHICCYRIYHRKKNREVTDRLKVTILENCILQYYNIIHKIILSYSVSLCLCPTLV